MYIYIYVYICVCVCVCVCVSACVCVLSSSSRSDNTVFSGSLAIRPYRSSHLKVPLDGTQCLHNVDIYISSSWTANTGASICNEFVS